MPSLWFRAGVWALKSGASAGDLLAPQSPTQMSPQTHFLPQFQDVPAAVVPSHSLCPFSCSSLGLPSVPGCRARAGDTRLAEAGWTLPP